nr:hypothetical protein [Tanacetum cinerariifolium]
GYSVVPPPPAQVYAPPKKDMSSTGLPEFKNDTVTDYSRPSPVIESTSDNAQNRNPSVTETKASPSTISHKPFIKFMKATDRSTETKTTKVETAKPAVKYAAMYSKPLKSSEVRGNRNWNNLKSYQLGLAQVEARLAEHRNQELIYCEKIRVIEFKTESRANCIESLTKDLELLKKEK